VEEDIDEITLFVSSIQELAYFVSLGECRRWKQLPESSLLSN
jgi:hypothetical protein